MSKSKQDFDAAQQPVSPPSPVSIRFSWPQLGKLKSRANGQPLGTYIKEYLFHEPIRVIRQYREIDKKLIAKILAVLGQSRLSSNVNQLAKAANSGSLPVNEEVTKALMKACQTIEWIRITLIKALGITPSQPNQIKRESNDPEW